MSSVSSEKSTPNFLNIYHLMSTHATHKQAKLDGIILWFGLISLIILYLSQALLLAINTTHSLPQHLFLIIKHQPVHRGDYIAFYPPVNPLYRRHQLFIKQIAGIAGDKVELKKNCFYVHSQRIGIAKPRSRLGSPLTPSKTGVLGQGEYFVYTPHPDSFDSRYQQLGWVSETKVVGRAFAVF